MHSWKTQLNRIYVQFVVSALMKYLPLKNTCLFPKSFEQINFFDLHNFSNIFEVRSRPNESIKITKMKITLIFVDGVNLAVFLCFIIDCFSLGVGKSRKKRSSLKNLWLTRSAITLCTQLCKEESWECIKLTDFLFGLYYQW